MNDYQNGLADGVILLGAPVCGHLLGGVPGALALFVFAVGLVALAKRLNDRDATEEVTA